MIPDMPHLLIALAMGAVSAWVGRVLSVWLPQNILNQEAQWLAHVQEQAWQADPAHSLRACAAQSLVQWRQSLSWVLLGMVLAGALLVQRGASLSTVLWGLWMWALLTAAAIDFKTRLLPDLLTQPLLWLGLIIQTLNGLATVGLENALWGAVFGYMILWAMDTLYLRWRGISGVGQGDMKLLAAIGAWLGAQAVPHVLLLAAVAALIGQAALRLRRAQAPSTEFAFGPWIGLAAVAYWLGFARV